MEHVQDPYGQSERGGENGTADDGPAAPRPAGHFEFGPPLGPALRRHWGRVDHRFVR